jgi:hypothetical protein
MSKFLDSFPKKKKAKTAYQFRHAHFFVRDVRTSRELSTEFSMVNLHYYRTNESKTRIRGQSAELVSAARGILPPPSPTFLQ